MKTRVIQNDADAGESGINQAAPVVASSEAEISASPLEARDGVTIVRTEESYDGLLARIFRGRLQKTLEDSLTSGLAHLKAEAERRIAHLAAERRS